MAGIALSAAAASAAGATLSVRVLDRNGAPVPEVVVYARPIGHAPATAPTHGARAVMHQRDLAFMPHVLVAQTGTNIEFPNQDPVRHHVYSFSPARRLNLSVDAGEGHEPLRFETPGVVTLGCNIHDDMLAYILIVDTPSYATTDGEGRAVLSELASARYEVNVWTPRLAPRNLPGAVEIRAGTRGDLEIRLDAKLFPPHRQSETSLRWSHY